MVRDVFKFFIFFNCIVLFLSCSELKYRNYYKEYNFNVPSSYFKLESNNINVDSMINIHSILLKNSDNSLKIGGKKKEFIFNLFNDLVKGNQYVKDSICVFYIGSISYESNIITKLFKIEIKKGMDYENQYIIGINSKQNSIKSSILLFHNETIIGFNDYNNSYTSCIYKNNRIKLIFHNKPSDVTISDENICEDFYKKKSYLFEISNNGQLKKIDFF